MLALRILDQLGRDLAAAKAEPRAGADAGRERSGRRAQGAYFTPAPLVRFVVEETLRARLADPTVCWRADGSPALRILDPSAGDGRFLAAAADLLAAEAERRGISASTARPAIERQCLLGIERDPEFAALARARLPGATIHCREALLDAPPEAAGVDVVLGNPPYLRSIRMARADSELWHALKGRYAATSHGEWDLYAAFIEQSLVWTSPAGEIGLVVPSRWLTAAFARLLRAKLAQAGAVRAIVDFGATQVFPGATTYASVVFLSRLHRLGRAAQPAPSVAVARYSATGWRSGLVAASSLPVSGAPWRLAVGTGQRLMERLTRDAPVLGQVARIVKGAGTNADRVYVLEDCEVGETRESLGGETRESLGGLVRGWSHALGERVEVEAAALRPCARGRDVRAYGDVGSRIQCLIPYDPDGALWPPARLDQHPRAAAYLQRCRPVLDARESGRHRGAAYYRFGRPQNMAFLADPRPKIIIPDVARGGRALLDIRGALVLDSAYALRLREPEQTDIDLAMLLGILNSPVVGWWLAETGVPLRGGYVRLKTAYLSSLPVPRPSPATAELAALVSGALPDAPDHTAITDAVRRAYGIEPDDWAELVARAAG